MKKKIMLSILLASCMTATPAFLYAADAESAAAEESGASEEETAAAPAMSEAETAAAENDTEAEAVAELSDSIYDFQIKIGEDILQFPMTYAEFTASGWELDNDEDPQEKIGSNSYGTVTFYQGENRVYATVYNLSINSLPLEECLIGGVDLESGDYGVNLETTPVELACGIVMGSSGIDDITAAYGTPSDTYEGDYYTELTYEKDIYESIELYVDKETGVLDEADLANLIEPENFDAGEVSTETPEIVLNYTAPTGLTGDVLSPVVEFCGDLYELPAPVSAFLANGWEILDEEEGAYVAGDSIDFIDIMKDNQSVHLSVYNETEDAVLLENCFVESLEAATYDEGITLTLSDGTSLGVSRDEVIALAEAGQYVCEEDDSYINIYKNDDLKYDNYIQFWFSDDDPDIASAVTYLNRILPDQE